MDAIEAMLTRHSVRRFQSEPVPDEVIDQALKCANRAPSSDNTKPWRFRVTHNKKIIKKLANFVSKAIREERRKYLELSKAFPKSIEKIKPSEKGLMKISGKYITFFKYAPRVAVVTVDRSKAAIIDKYVGMIRPLDWEGQKEFVERELDRSVQSAVMNFLTAVHSEGYGACQVDSVLLFKSELESELKKLQKLLKIDTEKESLFCFIPVGKPLGKD